MVYGGGDFRRWLDHKGGALMNRIGAFIKETPEKETCEDTVKDGCLWTRKWDLINAKSASALILDFSASRTVRNKYVLFISYQVYGILL